MKRTRELEIAEMATCLMLLSRVGEIDAVRSGTDPVSSGSGRVFSCKTCNRQFASFQALGGHRTSHKKARVAEGEEGVDSDRDRSPAGKSKAHECSICGLEFAIGQALGGHMRRHRNAAVAVSASKESSETSRDREVVVVEESSGAREVCLDLKLGSYREIDLNLRLGLVL